MKKAHYHTVCCCVGVEPQCADGCANPQDANQDGVIGVDDLMDLLSHWGDTDFDFDGVYDSVDLCTMRALVITFPILRKHCLYLDAIGACGGDCAEDTDGDGVCDLFLWPMPRGIDIDLPRLHL